MIKKDKNYQVIYTGGGFGGSRQGLPAKNLTAEEIENLGGIDYVLSTGLYELVESSEEEKELTNDG